MRYYVEEKERLYLSPNVYVKGGKIYINGKKFGIDAINSLEKNEKIFLFKDWIEGWFFDILEVLINVEGVNFRSGFIILLSSLPYIEMIGQLRTGESSDRSSKQTFVNEFIKIFKFYKHEQRNTTVITRNHLLLEEINDENREKIAEYLYDKIRNGLMHNYMVKAGVKYSYKYPYTFEVKKINQGDIEYIIKINPKKFVFDLKNHFDEYVDILEKDEGELYKNFEKMFPKLHGKIRTIIDMLSGYSK